MLKEGNVKELVQRLTQAAPAAKRPSIQIFEQMPDISDRNDGGFLSSSGAEAARGLQVCIPAYGPRRSRLASRVCLPRRPWIIVVGTESGCHFLQSSSGTA